MTRDELIERLADVEHQRWADWQQWVHQQGERVLREGRTTCAGLTLDGGDLVLLANDVSRWERQIATPYADLSEREKQSDREQVMRYWPLIVTFVAEWLKDASCEDFAYQIPEKVWLEEMQERRPCSTN